MPKIALTQAAADRLPLPPKGSPAIVDWCRSLPGLGVRVGSEVRKTFIAQDLYRAISRQGRAGSTRDPVDHVPATQRRGG